MKDQYKSLRDTGIKTLEKEGKIRKVLSSRLDRELAQINDFNRSLIRSNLTLETPARQNGSQEVLDALHAYVTYTKIPSPVSSQEKFSLMKPARGTPEWRIAKLYEDQLDTKIDGLKTLTESIDKLRKVAVRREALAIEKKAKIASQSMV